MPDFKSMDKITADCAAQNALPSLRKDVLEATAGGAVSSGVNFT